jgi:hypothetical protein
MAKLKRLRDIYRFPGFVPRPKVRGIFGDPRAVVITLQRRRKKTLCGICGLGGGIYLVSTIMTISGCTLSGNSAPEGSAIENFNGWVTSGNKHNVTTNLTVSNSFFSKNSPTN